MGRTQMQRYIDSLLAALVLITLRVQWQASNNNCSIVKSCVNLKLESTIVERTLIKKKQLTWSHFFFTWRFGDVFAPRSFEKEGIYNM